MRREKATHLHTNRSLPGRHARGSMHGPRPYLNRIPDQSLIVGDADNGALHLPAGRDRDGSYAFVYFAEQGMLRPDWSGGTTGASELLKRTFERLVSSIR